MTDRITPVELSKERHVPIRVIYEWVSSGRHELHRDEQGEYFDKDETDKN